MATDKSKDRTKELLAQVEDGVAKLVTTDAWQEFLSWQAKFHQYSFGNAMLILFQCPSATAIMGYGAKDHSTGWLSVGRQVRPGEKAIWILAPILVPDEEASIAVNGKRPTKLVGYRSVPVFDISQTDGEDPPVPAHKLDGEDVDGLFFRLETIAQDLGYSVTTGEMPDIARGANGVTIFGDNEITVESDMSPLQQAKTLAHELGHALLHAPDKLSQDAAKAVTLTRPLIELEAESVAYVVLASLGIDSGDYSFGYVATWADGDPAEVAKGIKSSGARIQRAASKIIEDLEKGE